MTIEQLEEQYRAARAAYEAARKLFMDYYDECLFESLVTNVSSHDVEEQRKKVSQLGRSIRRMNEAGKVLEIARSEGIDRAMLWKLQHGGAR